MKQIFALLLSGLLSTTALAEKDIWLLVDTKAQNLSVNKGDKTLEVLENIAIGKNGAGVKEHIGDNVTPLGDYRIGWIDTKSAYQLFMGINYPSEGDARNALKKGLIKDHQYEAIAAAEDRGRIPPQNTPLGGRIGIHGLGRADPKIHSKMNWTKGCIALTNQQIMRLAHWVSPGTIIKIR